MFKKAKNSKQQGDIGLGSAISYLTMMGYTVSVPLTDSQDYDLVVDIEGKLNKVQVKTTSQKSSNGYEVELRTLGGNQSWNGVAKFFNSQRVDYLFVVTENGRRFFIPAESIEAKSRVTIGNEKYNEYEI
jgi:hypothetical protein